MKKIDPANWTPFFMKRKERFCVEVLERMNGAMQDALSEGDLHAAAHCADKLCEGLIKLTGSVSRERYAPMLYTYSYILAQIAMFGVGGERGLAAGISPLRDAYDFARGCERDGFGNSEKVASDVRLIGGIITDIESGRPLEEIKDEYCPDFPENLIRR